MAYASAPVATVTPATVTAVEVFMAAAVKAEWQVTEDHVSAAHPKRSKCGRLIGDHPE